MQKGWSTNKILTVRFFLVASIAFAVTPDCSVFAATLPWIYFTDVSASTVNRMAFDGTDFQVLANTDQFPYGLAIDQVDRKMYWSESPPGAKARIHRADLDGSNPSVFYEAASPSPVESILQLAIGEASRQIYWVDSAARQIRTMNLDGSGLMNVFSSAENLGPSLELDASGEHLYFSIGTAFNSSRIERINIDGTDRQPVSATFASSLFLDESHGRIYGADWDKGQIFELTLPNFERHNLVAALNSRDVQRYGDYLIYAEWSFIGQTGGAGLFSRIVRSDLNGEHRVVLREVDLFAQGSDVGAILIYVPEPSTMSSSVLVLVGLYRLRASPRGWPQT